MYLQCVYSKPISVFLFFLDSKLYDICFYIPSIIPSKLKHPSFKHIHDYFNWLRPAQLCSELNGEVSVAEEQFFP